MLESLGVSDVTLKINSTGDHECRPDYIKRLDAHYRPNLGQLCDNCVRRLDENPLRLLDCKEESCILVKDDAPHSVDYLCKGCEDHWDKLLGYLNTLGITYQIDNALARGFDYYTRTVFEIVPPGHGSQNRKLLLTVALLSQIAASP